VVTRVKEKKLPNGEVANALFKSMQLSRLRLVYLDLLARMFDVLSRLEHFRFGELEHRVFGRVVGF
jgi:hypothetical protein